MTCLMFELIDLKLIGYIISLLSSPTKSVMCRTPVTLKVSILSNFFQINLKACDLLWGNVNTEADFHEHALSPVLFTYKEQKKYGLLF